MFVTSKLGDDANLTTCTNIVFFQMGDRKIKHQVRLEQVSNEKTLVVGDYTTQFYGDYNKLNHYKDPY